nr:thermonuclease family protein [Azospirillum sp. SYSU D00513]
MPTSGAAACQEAAGRAYRNRTQSERSNARVTCRPALLHSALSLGAALLACAPAAAEASGPSRAQAAPAEAAPVRVAAVIDGDTLELADGRRVRLAGILAPKAVAAGDPGSGERRLADSATAALRALAQGRAVSPAGLAPTDRHGRLLTQLVRDDGLWIQQALVSGGHVRVQTRPDARERAAELLAAEAEARGAGRGLWRSAGYAVRPADPDLLHRHRDSFQIVEGRVLAAALAGGAAYLNFGADRRTDVTVRIAPAALRLFARAGVDPLAFQGRAVRVRGWVGLRNGPMIEASHPEQIELLGQAPPAPDGCCAPVPEPMPEPGPGPGPDPADEEASE